MRKAMLLDPSKCMACRACQVACKVWNQLPAEDTTFTGSYENPTSLSPITWTRIVFQEKEINGSVKWYFGNQRCMHCTDAACMTACPTGAIYHTSEGTVDIDYRKCIGCLYCVANCPFHVINFDRRSNLPQKCTFCYDRISNGLKPACAAACPTGAIIYGDRNKIVTLAHTRVGELKALGNGKVSIYGLEDLSGTGMIQILEDEPEMYSLPKDPEVPLRTRVWGTIFKPIRVLAVIALGFGLWINRSETSETQNPK